LLPVTTGCLLALPAVASVGRLPQALPAVAFAGCLGRCLRLPLPVASGAACGCFWWLPVGGRNTIKKGPHCREPYHLH